MINKTSQKGSAHVVIIVILVVALLGVLGFVFWRNTSKNAPIHNNTGSENPSSQNSSPDTLEESYGYLTLSDFNVKIPLNAETSSLKLGSVTSSSHNEADNTLPIIASELDSTWKCESDPSSAVKGTIGSISVTTQAKRSGPYGPLVTKKVRDRTFGFEQAGSNCTDNPKYQRLVDAFKVQFSKLGS